MGYYGVNQKFKITANKIVSIHKFIHCLAECSVFGHTCTCIFDSVYIVPSTSWSCLVGYHAWIGKPSNFAGKTPRFWSNWLYLFTNVGNLVSNEIMFSCKRH